MKRGVLIFTTVLALTSSTVARSQTWLDRLSVRQNAETKKDVAQPAIAQVTVPDTGSVKHTVAFAVLYDLHDSSTQLLTLFAEHLRNSELTKPQNSFRSGLSWEWQPTDISVRPNRASPVITVQGNYKHDDVAETDGAQLGLSYTHVFISKGLPNTRTDLGESIRLTYSPVIGLEAELADSAAGDSRQVVRAVFRLDLGVYPFARKLDEKLELLAGGQFRRDIGRNDAWDTRTPDHTNDIFAFEANYYPLKTPKRSGGFGVIYASGADPSKGFQKQQYWLFGLKLRL